MKVKVGIAQMACSADKQANIDRYTEKEQQHHFYRGRPGTEAGKHGEAAHCCL